MKIKLEFFFVFFASFRTSLCITLDDKCIDYAENIHKYHPTENLDAPDPFGKWISPRCEIIPSHYVTSKGYDPKYIVRQFDLLKGPWNGFFYHYHDSWCTKPTFIVKIKGTYDVMTATATTNSQLTKAATFKFANIYFRTTSKDTLESIFNFVNLHCPSAILITSKLKVLDQLIINVEEHINRDIEVNATEILSKKKCRYYFGLHYYSYQKIRMVHDKNNAKSLFDNNIEHDQLFFAEVPPKHNQLSKTELDEFQYGLSRLSNPDCSVCKKFKAQNDANIVPILTAPTNRHDFTGDWVSPTCEAKSGTDFLTRYYKILPKLPGQEYGEVYASLLVFSDSDCKYKSLGIVLGGIYTASFEHKTADDVMLIKMKYTSLAVTPHDESMLGLLKFSGAAAACGDTSKWAIGESQNVTLSAGCSPLQIKLPRDTLAVIRVINGNNREIYIREDDQGDLKYFTKSLVSCASKLNSITKTMRTTERPIVLTSRVKTIIPNIIPDINPVQEQTGAKPPGNKADKDRMNLNLCLSLLSFVLLWNLRM